MDLVLKVIGWPIFSDRLSLTHELGGQGDQMRL
jgi:hypothetical protein